jgi:hypothetical protein
MSDEMTEAIGLQEMNIALLQEGMTEETTEGKIDTEIIDLLLLQDEMKEEMTGEMKEEMTDTLLDEKNLDSLNHLKLTKRMHMLHHYPRKKEEDLECSRKAKRADGEVRMSESISPACLLLYLRI